MSARAIWSWWRQGGISRNEPGSAGSGPAEDFVVTDALEVQRVLGELVRLRRTVELQTADGRFTGCAELRAASANDVVLGPCANGSPLEAGQGSKVNAAVSTAGGMAMFTLADSQPVGAGCLRARSPRQLILVQSRRHFRLAGLAGRHRRAWLVWPGSGTRLPLRDLSEEGLGLELGHDDWRSLEEAGAAGLHLDGELLLVPRLQMVHRRPAAAEAPAVLGARLLGMSGEDLRSLRRWIAATQALSPAAPAAQAVSTRSKR
jgi:hypothetical protein